MHELRIMVSIVGLLDQFGRKIDHLDQKRRYIYINELQGSTMANLLKGKDAKLRVYGSYELWQPGYRKSMLFLICGDRLSLCGGSLFCAEKCYEIHH
jgi:hypothetical protein